MAFVIPPSPLLKGMLTWYGKLHNSVLNTLAKVHININMTIGVLSSVYYSVSSSSHKLFVSLTRSLQSSRS